MGLWIILAVILGVPIGLAIYYLPKALKHIYTSIKFVWSGARPFALIQEENGVEGCGFFYKVKETKADIDVLHCLGKITRLGLSILAGPLFLIPLINIPNRALDFLKVVWFWEKTRPHKAVLAPSGKRPAAQFNPTGYKPTYLVRIWPKQDGSIDWRQVDYPEHTTPYTAISYSFRAALPMCGLSDPKGTGAQSTKKDAQNFTLEDRRDVAIAVLKAYTKALHPSVPGNKPQGWVEHIWIDELCLSKGPRVDDTKDNREIRDEELGRLADIFSGATDVVVFCNSIGCGHLSLECPWNGRLFTIGEIYNAEQVVSMIRIQSDQYELHRQPGRLFRRSLQNNAEKKNEALHLHALMKSSPGPIDSQSTIHSLIVEALRRDDLDEKFFHHNQLGRALNGLLARRAQWEAVPGKDGWADLCWLLELNQGHFNAATLAAVCSLDAGSRSAGTESNGRVPLRHPWLGKPVLPEPGTERLEPLVTAIPVANPLTFQSDSSALTIVGPKIVGVAPFPRRDQLALFRHPELRGLLLLTITTFLGVCIYSLISIVSYGSILPFWFSFSIISAAQLISETTCLVCDGWIHLDVETWGTNPQKKLEELDCRLRSLTEWGDPKEQPMPKWHPSSDSRLANMVDLGSGNFVTVHTLRKPNAMLPLAVHGCGITCMLLDRQEEFNLGAQRVGMANVPPYILAQAKRAASVIISGKIEMDPESADQRVGLWQRLTQRLKWNFPVKGTDELPTTQTDREG